jgi:hypothetical protein
MPAQRPPVALLQPRGIAARKRIEFYRKVQRIKLRAGRSWRNLRLACLDLLGREVQYSTRNVGEQSRIFARRVCRETGLLAEEILAWLDREGLGNGK